MANRALRPVSPFKNGDLSVHPMSGRELRARRRLKREQEPASPFVFTSECGSPFTRGGIAKLVARAGVEAGFDHAVHAHMLRHACGRELPFRIVNLHACCTRWMWFCGILPFVR
jgi:type 1 fimbriae regulatory protein FimB/type 1 fimbriae regulatory protein FimE